MNQKKLGGSAINCDAFVSNNVSHVLRTHRNSSRRIITKPSFETKNNNQESDNINDRTPSKPVGRRRIDTPGPNTARRSKDCNSTTSSGWLSRRKQRIGRASSGRGRTGRRTEREERFRQRRTHQDNVEVSRRATTQPLPTLHLRTAAPLPSLTPPERTTRVRSGTPTTTTSNHPLTVPPPKSYEEAYNVERRARLCNPSTRRTTTFPTSHVTHRGRPGKRHAKPEIQEIQQQHRLTPVERTPTPDNTVARQATDLT